MVVKPKPIKPQDNKDINEVINKGAHVREDSQTEKHEDKWIMISLRLPKPMLRQIDEKRKKKVGLSRNALILQKLQQWLEDEN